MSHPSQPQVSRFLADLGLSGFAEPGSVFEGALASAAGNLAKLVSGKNLDEVVRYALRSGTQVAGASEVQRHVAESQKKVMIADRIAPKGETA